MSNSRQNDAKPYTEICFICNEEFSDPRLLECYHTYCFNCIDEYIEANSKQGNFDCPMCKSNFKVPEDGTQSLKKNVFVGNKRASEEGKVSCDVCGEKSKAKSFCYECDQHLCTFCVNFHTKLQATKDHNVAALDDSGARRVTSRPKCATHEKNELQYFCDECKELICIDCNMTTHKMHKCRDLPEVADEFRTDLSRDVSKEEYQKHLNALHTFSKDMKKNKGSNKDNEDRMITSIEERKVAFESILDEITMDLISDMSDSNDNNSNGEKGQKLGKERRFKAFAAVYFFSKLMLDQADDTAIVTHTVKLRQRLEDLLKNKVKGEQAIPLGVVFEPGTIDKEVLRKMFGCLVEPNGNEEENVERKEGKKVAKFLCKFDCPPGDCVVSGIATTDDGDAWVCLSSDTNLQLFDSKGKCKKTVPFSHPLDDLVVCNGMLYVTSNGTHLIRTVENDKKTVLLSMDMCIRGITADENTNTLILGLTENDAFFSVSERDRASICYIKNKTDTKKMDGNSDVKYPARLTRNTTGKVFVADWFRAGVIVLNSQGETEKIYRGKSENEEFHPRGICSDTEGNVYVVDMESESVQLLDETGAFQSDILTKADGISSPWSLAYDKFNRLWVGSQEGTVSVFSIE